ncbi:hypothetical protein BpHYR1_043737 [Brachionus plicatilis]|uniref:Uncharacterized protein n=1 Tax=Brachionus plicatilis TaxID=10195 RepID=A0A3M7PI87_BRAPC|nr:hypothetical protein BpHYR1_043737 [Brachionus plicatilis]
MLQVHFSLFYIFGHNVIISKTCSGAILQNLHRFCRFLQKVKQQLFHFVSFTEQFCMKFHNGKNSEIRNLLNPIFLSNKPQFSPF